MVEKYHAREKVTVCQVQKLVGHQNIICQALPANCPFLVSLYRLTAALGTSHKLVKVGHQRRLNKETVNDLKMFWCFLSSTAHYIEHTVPFLVRRAVFADSLQLFADSSFEGFGCCFQNSWVQGFWSKTTVFNQDIIPNIAILELFAIVVALELWAEHVAGKCIMLRSDSTAMVGWLSRKQALIPAIPGRGQELDLQPNKSSKSPSDVTRKPTNASKADSTAIKPLATSLVCKRHDKFGNSNQNLAYRKKASKKTPRMKEVTRETLLLSIST